MTKDREKRPGIKHKIRQERERRQGLRLALVLTVLVSIIFVSGFITYSILSRPPTSEAGSFKAAIVDQLSLTFPNHTFVQTATNILKRTGFTVDYYPGEVVTVDFYRNLPTHGYGLIILRVHSSATSEGESFPVTLFTSERYDESKHVYDQLTDRLAMASYSSADRQNGIFYFGIEPSFVGQSMNGRFQKTVIIMMGCEGLENHQMASALVSKGAVAFISWTNPVLASHTDTATTRLLEHLATGKRTIRDSVVQTMREVGPDPSFQSELAFFPANAGDFIVHGPSNQLVASSSEAQYRKPGLSFRLLSYKQNPLTTPA